MIDKFKIFNKIKVDTSDYIQDSVDNKDKLKLIMKDKLKDSERLNKKRRNKKITTTTAASIGIVVIGVATLNPSLADDIVSNIKGFETMLDKIRNSVVYDATVEYDPSLYPELEEEKRERKENKLIATDIGVLSENNGLEITLDKALYDKKKVFLDMTLETNEVFKESEYIKAVGDSPYGDGEKNMYLDIQEILINDIKQDSFGYSSGVVEFIDEGRINLTYLIELDLDNDVEDANIKINFGIREYSNDSTLDGNWSFDFNIKAIDDGKTKIDVNEEDGGYTLQTVSVTDTYVEVQMELPFQPALGNPHNNFIILMDDKGREIEMSSGADGENKMYTQMNNLVNIGEIPKYIDIYVIEDFMKNEAIASFRVNIK